MRLLLRLLLLLLTAGCLADNKGNLVDCRRCTCTASTNPHVERHKWKIEDFYQYCEWCGIGDET